ncbi:DNA recombination protein RmuC, partial [Lactococcus lactis]
KVQERLQQSEKEISNLITTRTNVMNRKLRNINEIDNSKSSELLGIDNE